MLAVLQVVYELAACPWRDTIPNHTDEDEDLPNPLTTVPSRIDEAGEKG